MIFRCITESSANQCKTAWERVGPAPLRQACLNSPLGEFFAEDIIQFTMVEMEEMILNACSLLSARSSNGDSLKVKLKRKQAQCLIILRLVKHRAIC